MPIHSDYICVDDADEEIFLLYTDLQRTPTHSLHSNGLGYVDSKQDVLTVSFDIDLPPTKTRKRKVATPQKESISVDLAQDKTALRTRKGDTGSILWRVSVELARLVLQQHSLPTEPLLFDYAKLKDSHILELGSGTGLLAILLSPLAASYTATDLEDLVPLIRKNVTANVSSPSHTITIAPLDWTAVHNAPRNSLSRLLPQPYDQPLIDTMNALSSSQTFVLVLAQLREVEVLREFVGEWINSGWEIWRIEHNGTSVLGPGFVAWMGRCSRTQD